jgi:hypothetical protein
MYSSILWLRYDMLFLIALQQICWEPSPEEEKMRDPNPLAFGASLLLIAFVASGTAVLASDDAAVQATDPSAILTQIGFFYWTTIPEGTSRNDSDTFLFQPVLPLSKGNVLRPALPLLTSPEPDRKAGLGDLLVLDFQFFQAKKLKSTIGVGGAATFPTASDDLLGSGKYSIGPGMLWIYKGVPKNIFGVLVYNQTSVGGDDDRDDVNVMTVQPVWVGHFKWGYIGWTDQSATMNWETHKFTAPAGLRFGKVVSGKETLWNLAVQPYWTFREGGPADNDSWGVKFSATLVLPNMLKH